VTRGEEIAPCHPIALYVVRPLLIVVDAMPRDEKLEALFDALAALTEWTGSIDLPGQRLRMDEALRAVYDSLPTMECRKLCGHTFCSFIAMSPYEAGTMDRACSDAGISVQWVELSPSLGPKQMRGAAVAPRVSPTTGTCIALDQLGRCRVYDARPLICRLWGVVEAMSCPHGCAPEYWLSEGEARNLQNFISVIGDWE
jgi:hypothetical protein